MRLRSRSALSWGMLAAAIVASVAISYGAYTLAGYAWDQVVDYKSPYVRQPGAAETSPTTVWVPDGLRASYNPSAPVLAQRVVLVIVDGMRDDVSRSEFSTLNKLRTYGADITLTAPQPSLSYPELDDDPDRRDPRHQRRDDQLVRWSRARPDADGRRRSRAVGRSKSWAPRTSRRSTGCGRGPNVSLRPWPKGGYLSGTLIDDALRIAKATDPDLIVIHLPDLDEAGHEHGGASEEYRAVAHRIDIDLARLVDRAAAGGHGVHRRRGSRSHRHRRSWWLGAGRHAGPRGLRWCGHQVGHGRGSTRADRADGRHADRYAHTGVRVCRCAEEYRRHHRNRGVRAR